MAARKLFIAGFLACLAMIGTALYFQYGKGLEPCPLCIFQRVTVLVMGAVFAVAALHGPKAWGRRVYGSLVTLVALVGVGIAGRHLWLQHAPADQIPSCGPGLDFYLQTYPFLKALKLVLQGSGECSEIVWTFLGLSIPGWTLLAFLGFVGFGLFLTLRRR
jgi:disulfide bond formation protein DsbB